MAAQLTTFAFHGFEARAVTVQAQLGGSGSNHFALVGLPDKAISEARHRVSAALTAIGLGLPPKRVTVKLPPAELPKEGGHFDPAIALGLLIELGAFPPDGADGYGVIGELGLMDRSRLSTARCRRPSPPTRMGSVSSVRQPMVLRLLGPGRTSR